MSEKILRDSNTTKPVQSAAKVLPSPCCHWVVSSDPAKSRTTTCFPKQKLSRHERHERHDSRVILFTAMAVAIVFLNRPMARAARHRPCKKKPHIQWGTQPAQHKQATLQQQGASQQHGGQAAGPKARRGPGEDGGRFVRGFFQASSHL